MLLGSISTSQVAISLFIIFSGLEMTFHFTRRTYSALISGNSNQAFDGSKVTCVIQYLSLKSMKVIHHKFLALFTQPVRVTSCHKCVELSSQQV
jgi:hypothetical protein